MLIDLVKLRVRIGDKWNPYLKEHSKFDHLLILIDLFLGEHNETLDEQILSGCFMLFIIELFRQGLPISQQRFIDECELFIKKSLRWVKPISKKRRHWRACEESKLK